MTHRLKKKTLCDWSRSDIENKTALLAELTAEPRFACKKCARVALGTTRWLASSLIRIRLATPKY